MSDSMEVKNEKVSFSVAYIPKGAAIARVTDVAVQ